MHQIAQFKKIFLWKHAPSPLGNAWLSYAYVYSFAASNSPSPPLANPAYADGLLLRNLFEEMRS